MNKNKYLAIIISSLLFACQPYEKAEKDSESSAESVPTGTLIQKDMPKSFQMGDHAAQEVIAGWDIDIRPDGMGLPPGSGSVEDGEEMYEEKCASCHGSFGEGEGSWPKLAGGEGTLTDARPTKSVGSYWPYASTLWDYIHRAMPFPAPQSLEDDEVYAITAYVLYLNEIVEDDFVLTKENFATIKMPNQDSFYVDDRPDTSNTRCMENCRDATTITEVLGPEYTVHILEAEAEAKLKALSSNEVKIDETMLANYNGACKVCHSVGIAGAPKYGVSEDWTSRLAQSKDTIYNNALSGLNGMPAKGGRSDLSDDAVKAVVDYMLNSVNAK
ncbi:MAG: cytochrome C [Kangiella sp.]|nr:MAG: cytochrome C [Kangiella sp.]